MSYFGLVPIISVTLVTGCGRLGYETEIAGVELDGLSGSAQDGGAQDGGMDGGTQDTGIDAGTQHSGIDGGTQHSGVDGGTQDGGMGCADSDGDGLGRAVSGNLACAHPTTDSDDRDPERCADTDGDGCDDCAVSAWDPSNDGLDTDADGECDLLSADPDGDGINSDGDDSGGVNDNPCKDGRVEACDDNCPLLSNAAQEDVDNDGIGDACDAQLQRDSSLLVAVGAVGAVLYSSNDGETWAAGNHTASAVDFEAVAFGHGVWIAAGKDELYLRSTDGINWQSFSDTVAPGNAFDLEGVAHDGKGRWMMVAVRGAYAYSDDGGLSWVAPGILAGGENLEDVWHHQGRWVGVGQSGTVVYTDDPTTLGSWTELNLSVSNLEEVHYSGGVWATVGEIGQIWTSADNAESWQSGAQVLGGEHGQSIVFGGDRWMASGGGGTISYSTTSAGPWTTRDVKPPLGSRTIYGTFFEEARERWIVTTNGEIGYSDNGGDNWVKADDAVVADRSIQDVAGN